jgi:hypothetical protein
MDLVQATQFIPYIRRRVSTKSTHNCVAHCFLTTQIWRCQIRPIAKATLCWKCNTSETRKRCHASTMVFSVVTKKESVGKPLLNKLHKCIAGLRIHFMQEGFCHFTYIMALYVMPRQRGWYNGLSDRGVGVRVPVG